MANSDTDNGAAGPLRVLQSFPAPDPSSNPYVRQLVAGLAREPAVEPVVFTWRGALFGRVHVFHAHWPEALIERRRPAKTWLRRVLYLLFLVRLRLMRVPIVRTLHNLERPRDMGRAAEALLRLTERWTTLWITLNAVTQPAVDRPTELILHSDYRDWFEPYPRDDAVAGRIIFFGRIRGYKNVPRLIAAFRAFTDADATLHLVGQPSSRELEAELRGLSAGDDRITLRAHHVDDAELVRAVTSSELVVLPYAEMHNSGSVLAALSLDRPVLVPNNAVNRLLREEVGARWVQMYEGELRAEHLTAALDAVRTCPADAPPDLHRRGWDAAAKAHVRAYRRAIVLRRGARP